MPHSAFGWVGMRFRSGNSSIKWCENAVQIIHSV